MAIDNMIVNNMVSDLLSSLRSPTATMREREARLFALNAYLFEHELDAQVCFTDLHNDTDTFGIGIVGIAVFIGSCDVEGVVRQLINTQLLCSCDVVAFASPVEHNPRRIEVDKNRWGFPGLYENRDEVSAWIKRFTGGLRVTFTMRLP